MPVGQHNRGHEDFESEDNDERKRRRLEGDINIFSKGSRLWRFLQVWPVLGLNLAEMS